MCQQNILKDPEVVFGYMMTTPTCNSEYFQMVFPVAMKVSYIKLYPESAKTYKMDNKVGIVDIVYTLR